MNSKILLLVISMLFSFFILHAQNIKDLNTIEPSEEFENVKVKPLDDAADASTYIIWVKHNVKEHYHKEHTEIVYVIEGSGIMNLGSERKEIKKGDYIFIPRGTKHSVEVKSKEMMKVISIQTPHFDGTDRHFTMPD